MNIEVTLSSVVFEKGKIRGIDNRGNKLVIITQPNIEMIGKQYGSSINQLTFMVTLESTSQYPTGLLIWEQTHISSYRIGYYKINAVKIDGYRDGEYFGATIIDDKLYYFRVQDNFEIVNDYFEGHAKVAKGYSYIKIYRKENFIKYEDNFYISHSRFCIFFIDEYRPQNTTGHNESDFSQKIISYKKEQNEKEENFFIDEIGKIIKNDFDLIDSIVNIPSSKSNKIENSMFCLANRLSDRFDLNNLCGSLVRHQSIESSHLGGIRSVEEHFRSMKIQKESEILGKRILLIDDITTTGNTFFAARKVLLDAGAAFVYCLSLGLTINLDR
jgi:predicted amidophosphoribosyltransferase